MRIDFMGSIEKTPATPKLNGSNDLAAVMHAAPAGSGVN